MIFSLMSSSCGEKTTRAENRHGPITATQIESAGIYTNAYDVVHRLRPAWLRGRASDRIPVYVNNQRAGGSVAALRSIPAASLQRVERLPASEAQIRFGLGHPSGAIIVTTR
jgi:hypothetical protein